MKNLYSMFNEAMEIVESCGIETGEIVGVSVNYRAKSRFGQCRRKNGVYTINISNEILVDETPYNAVMEVIIHEILHTCYNCMNHKAPWKEMANRVMYYYPEYSITRTTSYEKFGFKQEEINPKKENYVFVCEKCGQVIRRQRMSKFVQHYHDYTCGICGGNFKFDNAKSACQILTARTR